MDVTFDDTAEKRPLILPAPKILPKINIWGLGPIPNPQ